MPSARSLLAAAPRRHRLAVATALLLTLVLLANPLLPLAPPRVASGTGTIGAQQSVPAWTGRAFSYGINWDWNATWDNHGFAALAQRVGAPTALIALPEWLFCCPANWGAVGPAPAGNGDMPTYAAAGLTDLAIELREPAASHTNPGKLSPANLYTPIWSAPGVVNPANTWAVYVQGVARQYRGQVRIYQVWNEPDFTGNWSSATTVADPGSWWSHPPQPSELPNWQDSIFSYIRLLRVTYEVVKAVDPTAYVAPGGLGYPAFTDALLRYTDNPVDGSITADYPVEGGAYFDVMSFHAYPEWSTYDFRSSTWYNQTTDSDGLMGGWQLNRRNHDDVLRARGYDGQRYPAKLWLNTETGAASRAYPPLGLAGGDAFQRNYLLKAGLASAAAGVLQSHWYMLFDDEPDTTLTGSDPHKGLFYDITHQSPATASIKTAGTAYATFQQILSNARYDAASAAGLAPPANVALHAFRHPDGTRTWVVWAKTSGGTENATATWSLPTAATLTQRAWDYSATGQAPTRVPAGGAVALSLAATPLFLTETTASATATATATSPAGATATRPAATATAVPGRQPTPKPASLELPLYDDALRHGFANESWGGTFNLGAANPVFQGSRSIAVTYSVGAAPLAFNRGQGDLSTQGYTALQFAVHGGTAGAQPIDLRLRDMTGAYGPTVHLATYLTGGPVAGAWRTVSVPLRALGFANGAGLNHVELVNAATGPTGQWFLDNLQLVP